MLIFSWPTDFFNSANPNGFKTRSPDTDATATSRDEAVTPRADCDANGAANDVSADGRDDAAAASNAPFRVSKSVRCASVSESFAAVFRSVRASAERGQLRHLVAAVHHDLADPGRRASPDFRHWW